MIQMTVETFTCTWLVCAGFLASGAIGYALACILFLRSIRKFEEAQGLRVGNSLTRTRRNN